MCAVVATGERQLVEVEEGAMVLTQEPKTVKPAYRVPSMEEIRAIRPNGFRVASLFSGGGGSSLGYAMAGFKVVYASEFVAAARETYAANFPATYLDDRDIRTVTPADILKATGLKAGELDVLDGSPPCASFSTAGKREKHWGEEKSYSDTKQRTDDLFFEYTRILQGLQPRCFVAENVAGLVRGVAKGYFKEIHAALEACGYRVKARLLDAQWLGVPQCRQRVIFIGVRNDLERDPVHPAPIAYRYSIRDALPHVTRQMANSPYGTSAWQTSDNPSQTIGAGPSSGNGRSPPSTIEAIRTKKGTRSLDEPSPAVRKHGRKGTQSELTLECESSDARFAIGRELERMKPNSKSKKYFSLVKPDENAPSPTITSSAGGLSAAGVAHPTEIRKFTIAELRRVCSFPDDFVLTGTYAQQWERCGRAVPPLMMRAVAATIRDKILKG